MFLFFDLILFIMEKINKVIIDVIKNIGNLLNSILVKFKYKK